MDNLGDRSDTGEDYIKIHLKEVWGYVVGSSGSRQHRWWALVKKELVVHRVP